ncbi:hypothetical protein [Ralstonia pickettii]|jgi:hypothetical protein|uniref:hypothetical protein n=1 Tax=Ralstonia pickettii TaxID=329 RepID=UPI0015F934C6|nr:hypothetical protein [Ralstonia pickettii]MBX4003401.1 inovirus Gp2 family protein [Ralstonia pickettii]MBX4030206.1 inovirus Gp2 family protein [Ralstonia pickettii]MBX4071923.1 inovirus Gp2 family protein [Ralstonia pickettii]MBX4076957.1 inovirus Gp2 family protein [Ralstonia pickettii]MBX4089885.1 inovirus Gp2 family protein [Ralstonia pickettii]
MNQLNLPSTIDQRTLYGCAAFANRYLNFVVERDGVAFRQDGPNIALLASLDRFVWAALQTELAPFRLRGEMYWKRMRERDTDGELRIVQVPAYAPTAFPNPSFPGSDRLVTLLASIKDWLMSHPAAKDLLLPPHLRLLLDVFFDHPISPSTERDPNALAEDTGRSVAEVCNDFVDQFRQAMLTKKFLRRELHNWYFGSRENLMNLHAYLDDLFTRHPSLTVLHLRLLHASAPVGDPRYDLQALRDCRTKLFDRMRRNPALFAAKPGYVWAILPSLDGRYDLHLTLLIDTDALRKLLDDKRVEAELAGAVLKDYADMVGAYWVEVTGGQGRYFRSDRERLLYGQDWVHGEVRTDDAVLREKLKDVLGFLAVRRALVRLTSEPDGEYFGMRERKSRVSHSSVEGGKNAVPNGEGAWTNVLEISVRNP